METFATPANFLSQNRGRSPVVRVFTLEKQARDDLSMAPGGRERQGGRGPGRKKRVVGEEGPESTAYFFFRVIYCRREFERTRAF